MQLVTIHLTILAGTVAMILYADYLGMLYLRGKKTVLNARIVAVLHYGVFAGLWGMLISGAVMTYPIWEYAVTEPIFLLKMFFVLVLFVNGWFIGRVMHRASEISFHELTLREQRQLAVSGCISMLGWIGTTAIGFLFM